MKKLLRSSVNAIPGSLRGWIKHIPGVADAQRWIVREVLAGEPFVHTINSGPATGLHFEVTLPQDKAVWAGIYEPEFTEAIAHEVRPGMTCYDIGGFRGYLSGAMALAGASKVLVFEPLPENQISIRRLCQLNPALPIDLRPVALGDVDGTVTMKVMPDASMGKLASSTFQQERKAVREMQISIRRIDSMVAGGEVQRPDLVKIDVEGAELDVLRGAVATLEQARPTIFLEAHSADLERACQEELVRHGYAVQRLETYVSSRESTRHLVARPAHG